MSPQAQLFTSPVEGRTDAPELLAELQVDYTPGGVAVQLLLAALTYTGMPTPRRALDPSAGSGCWGRAMRAVFGPKTYMVGVEPRESEATNIAAAYNEAHTRTCAEFVERNDRRLAAGWLPFDLVATNPPFTAFEADNFWPAEFMRAGLLHARSFVAMYGLTQWGQSDAAQPVLRAWAPSMQLRVGGRVEHRGEGTKRWAPIPKRRQVPGGPTHEWRDNNGDSREYCLWVWSVADIEAQRLARHPIWRTVQLPTLPTALRRWSPDEVPGLYPISDDFVALVRGGL